MALKGGGPSGAVHRAQRGWRSANQLSVGPAAGDTWGGLGVSVWASCPLHIDSARPVEGAQSCARDTSVDRVDGYDFAHDMLLFLVGCVLKLYGYMQMVNSGCLRKVGLHVIICFFSLPHLS